MTQFIDKSEEEEQRTATNQCVLAFLFIFCCACLARAVFEALRKHLCSGGKTGSQSVCCRLLLKALHDDNTSMSRKTTRVVVVCYATKVKQKKSSSENQNDVRQKRCASIAKFTRLSENLGSLNLKF